MPSPKKPADGKSPAKKTVSKAREAVEASKDVVKKAKPVSAAKKVVAVVRGAATKLVSKSSDALLAEPTKSQEAPLEAPAVFEAPACDTPKAEVPASAIPQAQPALQAAEPPVAAPALADDVPVHDMPVAITVPVAQAVEVTPVAEVAPEPVATASAEVMTSPADMMQQPAEEVAPRTITITHDMIAARARQLWLERGCREGFAHEDWRDAEMQLHAELAK